jgi:hypothetical protein
MKVVLVRRLADSMDGVDVSQHQVGDTIDLSARDAEVLMAEGWVVAERRTEPQGIHAVERRRARRSSTPETLEEHLNRAS